MVRHAGPTHARVRIAYSPDQVRIEVADDGPQGPSLAPTVPRVGSGHGLIGMRERAALFGGQLDAGPCANGFRIRATLRTNGLHERRRRPAMISVVIADDQALVRAGFVVMVNSATDMQVLGEAADGAEAVALVGSTIPMSSSWTSGCRCSTASRPPEAITTDPATAATRVLMLTTFDLDDYVYRALRAGASGFLLKDTAPEELLAGIRTLADGDALLAPSVTRRLIREFANRPETTDRPSPALLQPLSAREREVLDRSGRRVVQRRDRRSTAHLCRHRQNPRQPAPHETRGPRPGPVGDDRLRDRLGHPRLTHQSAEGRESKSSEWIATGRRQSDKPAADPTSRSPYGSRRHDPIRDPSPTRRCLSRGWRLSVARL